MNIQSFKVTEKRNVILFGEADINGVFVAFAYDTTRDRFTALAYDKSAALGRFPNVHNQMYLVGRLIAKQIAHEA